MTMTLAPASRARCRVGNAARMRASLVTLPSLTGTLRSSRIRTRLPARSRSVISFTVMVRLLRLCDRSFGLLTKILPVQRYVEHAVGVAPFVVEPHQHLGEAPSGQAGLAGVDDSRAGIVVEVAGRQRFGRVAEHAGGQALDTCA